MPVWGYDFPPGRVAIQTLQQPWAPSWVAGLIDDKPVPFEETSAETTRGNFKPPLWRRSYLGRWHGLASADITRRHGRRHGAMGARAAEGDAHGGSRHAHRALRRQQARSRQTDEGVTSTQAGLPLTFQSRNRAIVFAKPHGNRERFLRAFDKGERLVSQLATVIGLWNFAEKQDWEIFVDGQKVTSFPHRSTANQRILIRDGVTYLAILPMPPTDLGRDAEIEIGPGGGGKATARNAEIAPALTISMFNMKRAAPVPLGSLDLEGASTERTYGGFVLEMGDAEQHGSFEAFAAHIDGEHAHGDLAGATGTLLEVAYRSGERPDGGGASAPTSASRRRRISRSIPASRRRPSRCRRLNGQWPYLPPGLERDTTWAQQGTTGRLEKNGAVLDDRGRPQGLPAWPIR